MEPSKQTHYGVLNEVLNEVLSEVLDEVLDEALDGVLETHLGAWEVP